MKRVLLVTAVMMAVSFSATSQIQPQGKTSSVTSPDGIRIAYEVQGEGMPALVFIHGWSCDRSYWKEQLEPFSKRFRVVAIDLAGHGESGLERKAWTIEAFGGDVAAVVEQLGLQRIILIGHSMGGVVITEAARRLPSRVAGLIMVDSYRKLGPGFSPEQVQAFVAPFRENFVEKTRTFVRSMFLPNSDSALVEQIVADMSSAPPAVALPAMEHALGYSREMSQVLKELKLPVMTINADNPPSDVASLKRYGVELMLMPGVEHFLMREDPLHFNRLLETAIEKITR
jgi:pimeloyl-ACP methyl ester carboxylesterase